MYEGEEPREVACQCKQNVGGSASAHGEEAEAASTGPPCKTVAVFMTPVINRGVTQDVPGASLAYRAK